MLYLLAPRIMGAQGRRKPTRRAVIGRRARRVRNGFREKSGTSCQAVISSGKGGSAATAGRGPYPAPGTGPEGPLPLDKIKSIAVPVTRRSAPKKLRRAGHPQLQPDEGVGGQIGESRRQRPGTAAAPSHRYHVGQRLRMLGGGRYWGRLDGTCRVVALLPHESGVFQYRVRSETENFERV